MNEDDRGLQDWFDRSSQELPRQPFTLQVVERVKRRERFRQLQRYAALLAGCFAVCLLLLELIVPLVRIAASSDYRAILVLPAAGLAWWAVSLVRERGFPRG